jgi:hypothetical protein
MFQSLKEDEACSDYLLDLLEYTQLHLLRVDRLKRARIGDIVRKFKEFNDSCQQTFEYCTLKTKPASRINSGLSEVVEEVIPVPNPHDKGFELDTRSSRAETWPTYVVRSSATKYHLRNGEVAKHPNGVTSDNVAEEKLIETRSAPDRPASDHANSSLESKQPYRPHDLIISNPNWWLDPQSRDELAIMEPHPPHVEESGQPTEHTDAVRVPVTPDGTEIELHSRFPSHVGPQASAVLEKNSRNSRQLSQRTSREEVASLRQQENGAKVTRMTKAKRRVRKHFHNLIDRCFGGDS